MIEIKNISKNFGAKAVLNNISLTLERGKIYGIVGKNGAGKTTLFRCIAGIESYTGVIDSEFDVLKNHIGLLETNPLFMSRITGWEYLKLLCTARKIKFDGFESKNIFDLPLGEYAENYSTGMKKKLALMAILMQKNDVFILDEPFNGIDIQSNILITALLESLKEQNKIVLISSHIFSTLSETCDSIHLMNNGVIEKQVTKEKYAELENELKMDTVSNKIDILKF